MSARDRIDRIDRFTLARATSPDALAQRDDPLGACTASPAGLRRRSLVVGAGLAWAAPLGAIAAVPEEAESALRAGGVIVAFRHALAPGTYDPPGFRLDDCGTQRNLSEEGRAQARRIGAWFETRGLKPARVRSSPWCRCVDTAALAFGAHQVWDALGSPRGSSESQHEGHLTELRRAVAAASKQPGRFDVWVTHMFVLSNLVGSGTGSGEGLVLRAGADGAPQVIARLPAL